MLNKLRRTLSMFICVAMLISGISAWGEQEETVQILQMVQSAAEAVEEPAATAEPEAEVVEEAANLAEIVIVEEAPSVSEEADAEIPAEEESPDQEAAEIPAEDAAEDIQNIAADIQLNAYARTMGLFDSWTLAVTLPEDEAGEITFASSDEKVALVDASGKITAIGLGSADITVSANGQTAVCKITVEAAPTAISLTADRTLLGVGEELQLQTSILPEGAATTLIYASTNTNVATVDENGKVTAVGFGVANIAVATHNGKYGAIRVIVWNDPAEVTVTADRTVLGVGEVLPLGYTFDAYKAGSVTFTTSDATIAEITDDGLFAKAPGKVTVTATAYNGVEGTLEVEVKKAPTGITLNAAEHKMGWRDSYQLEATLADGEAGLIIYESSDPAIVTVDANGKLYANWIGTVTITAKTFNGKEATCEVTATVAPTAVGLAADRTLLGVGEEIQLETTVLPEGAETSLIYASTNTNVATVDENGKVTAVGFGVANIAVATHNGKYGAIRVIVWNDPAEVNITADRTVLGVGEELQLGYTFDQYKAGSVTFTSGDENIVEITDSGLIAAKKVGKVTITATAHNGVAGTLEFEVKNAPTGITLNAAEHKMGWRDSFQLEATLADGEAGLITYESSDPAIVSVDANGKLYANWIGTVTITAKTYNEIVATCEITATVPPTAVLLAAERTLLGVGEEIELKTTVLPEGAVTSLIYASTNPNVATVDANGKVTAVGFGVANVAVATHNGKFRMIQIIVWNAPEEVNITADRTVLGVGEELQLGYTFDQYKAGSVTFTSGDENIAEITDSGLITAKKAGVVTIIATAHNGVEGTLEIEVKGEPTGITLNATEHKMGWRDSYQLEATLADGEAGLITYESSDPAIVSVDANGKLYANWIGTVTITATAYNGETATCEITATAPPTAVLLAAERTLLGVGEEIELKTTVLPEGAETSLIYASTNPNVATVDANGKVTAVGFGVANVAVATHNGKFRMIQIIVWNAPEEVNITADRTVLGVGEELQLGCTFDQYKAGSVTFTSGNKNIAEITDDGLFIAKKPGVVTITATAHNGVEGTLEFEVKKAPSKVKLNATEHTMGWADSYQLEATLADDEAGLITYKSSDENIVTVDANGKVFAKWLGTATITASSYAGEAAQCEITVVAAPTGVVLSADHTSIAAGETMQLNAGILPEGAASTLTYVSGNPAIATVDANGMVTGLQEGVVVIAAWTHNGKAGAIVLTVTKAPDKVIVEAERTKLAVGEKAQLKAGVSNGVYVQMAYASSDEGVATVDENGVVTAVGTGRATITAAIAAKPEISDSVEIEVVAAPTKVNVSFNEKDVTVGETITLEYSTDNGNVGPITFASSDETVAKVSDKGVITTLKAGQAEIRINTHIESVYAVVRVTVHPALASITLSGAATMYEGATVTLQAALNPADALAVLSYSSSDETIATVDANGTVKALKPGTVKITVTADNGVSASLQITVEKLPLSYLTSTNADGTLTITGINQDFEGVLEIPATIDGKTVTAIGASAFSGRSLTSVVIPAGVTSIGARAFENCTKLGTLIIPAGVTTLGTGIFTGCTGVKLMVTIGSEAEDYAKENNIPYEDVAILIPAVKTISVTTRADEIGETATWTVTAAGGAGNYSYQYQLYRNGAAYNTASEWTSANTFSFTFTEGGCYELRVGAKDSAGDVSPYVNGGTVLIGGHSDSTGFDYVVYSEDTIMITGITTASATLEIPEKVDGMTVAAISDYAFRDLTIIESVVLPNTITKIGASAFSGCSKIASINLPTALTEIGSNAFNGCSALKGVTLPAGLKTIGAGAFIECDALTAISVPDGVTTMGEGVFAGCDNLTTANLPAGLTVVNAEMFNGCAKLTAINIPATATAINASAFAGCASLTAVTIPASVKTIGEGAFSGCTALKTLTLNEGLVEIGATAFYQNSSLTSLKLPSTVTYVRGQAFYGCAALETVELSANLQRINNWTFYGCKALTSIAIPASVDRIGDYAFSDCTVLASVTVPSDSKLTGVGQSAFYKCAALTGIALPDSVTEIGVMAFDGCSALANFNLPAGLTAVNDFTFQNCSSLTSVTVPAGVTRIGVAAFAECSGLTEVNLSEGLVSIDYHAFYACTGLKTIYIPGSVTEFGDDVFEGMSSEFVLAVIDGSAAYKYAVANNIPCGTYEGTLTYDAYLYTANSGAGTAVVAAYNGSEASVVVPATIDGLTVVEIGDGAFEGNTTLTTIDLPDTVTVIGARAFANCTNLVAMI